MIAVSDEYTSVNEDDSPHSLCEAKLANLTRAVEILTAQEERSAKNLEGAIGRLIERSTEHTAAVNTFGAMLQSAVDVIQGFGEKFGSLSPQDLIKSFTGSLFGKGK